MMRVQTSRMGGMGKDLETAVHSSSQSSFSTSPSKGPEQTLVVLLHIPVVPPASAILCVWDHLRCHFWPAWFT